MSEYVTILYFRPTWIQNVRARRVDANRGRHQKLWIDNANLYGFHLIYRYIFFKCTHKYFLKMYACTCSHVYTYKYVYLYILH